MTSGAPGTWPLPASASLTRFDQFLLLLLELTLKVEPLALATGFTLLCFVFARVQPRRRPALRLIPVIRVTESSIQAP